MPKVDSYSKTSLTGVLLANGTVPLTANWNMGAFSATFTKTGATAATVYDGFVLSNTTAASLGNQMYSGALRFLGKGWGTTAGTSQSVEFRQYVTPVQGGVPTGSIIWDFAVNGGSFGGTLMSLSSAGLLQASNITTGGNLTAQNGGVTTGITNRTMTLNSGIGFSTASSFGVTIPLGTLSQTSGNNGIFSISATYNQTSGTAANTDLLVNRVETLVGNGAQLLFDTQVGGTSKFKISNTGKVTLTNALTLKGYTVATLPTGTQGDIAFVTDALTPTFLVTVVGGGAVVSPVFYNGTAWVTY